MTKKNCVMVFGHDDPTAIAFLEYSYVPTGSRIKLPLQLGQNVVSQMDQVGSDISKVQVYCLVDGNFGTDNWYLPPDGNDKSIVYASVYVARRRVVGTVHFADGTSATDERPLKSDPLPCPTHLE